MLELGLFFCITYRQNFQPMGNFNTMSKTKTYLYISALVLVIIACGYILNIAAIKSFCTLCLTYAKENTTAVTAAACTFIFLGNRGYWFVILGCAALTALIIQFAIVGHNASLIVWAARIVTFMGIAFIMNFVRLLIHK